jgi:uncharacterized protein YajQ (UPF0234 family)
MPSILDLNAVKQGLERKDTDELMGILSYNQDDYMPEVIQVVKDILINRGITDQQVNVADVNYKNTVTKAAIDYKTGQREAKIPKYLLWFMYLAGAAMLKFVIGLIIKASV